MTELALHLGPLRAQGSDTGRSGVRWLWRSGAECKAGDVLAFCNIGLQPSQPGLAAPFQTDHRDLQVAFLAPIGGRVKIEPEGGFGGMMDQLASRLWVADDVLCVIETDEDGAPTEGAQQAHLLMLAGRRMAEVVEVRSGPLSGWHDLNRAWSGEMHPGPFGTLLGLGSCDLTDVLLGPSRTFAELISGAPGGVQIVRTLDEPLVPCAPVLMEQLQRTPEMFAAIAKDVADSLAAETGAPPPADMIYIGALLAGLKRRVLTEPLPVLTRGGMQQVGRPDAIMLSLRGEEPKLIRHRRLGYTLNLHGYRIVESGPWLRGWLKANFEPVERTFDDIKRDLQTFLAALDPGVSTLMLNAVSDSPGEELQNYQGFSAPLSGSVRSIQAKEMNLMLHDLAKSHAVQIIDVEAIAADFGRRRHTISPMHHSGAIQAEVREEILCALAARGTPGFARTPSP